MYVIHLRKVARAAATYRDQYGALALCTAVVGDSTFYTNKSYICFSFTRLSMPLDFS